MIRNLKRRSYNPDYENRKKRYGNGRGNPGRARIGTIPLPGIGLIGESEKGQ